MGRSRQVSQKAAEMNQLLRVAFCLGFAVLVVGSTAEEKGVEVFESGLARAVREAVPGNRNHVQRKNQEGKKAQKKKRGNNKNKNKNGRKRGKAIQQKRKRNQNKKKSLKVKGGKRVKNRSQRKGKGDK